MLSRRFTLVSLLGASVAVPYGVSKAPQFLEQKNPKNPAQASLSATPLAAPGGVDNLAAQLNEEPGAVLYPNAIPLEGPPAIHFEEVFRFDATKDWVLMRWPRKSTAMGDGDLFGIRVPLVTGTAVDDLAGSLTYYFDPAGHVQHIAFRGRTGDTRRLVRALATRYGLAPQPPTVPGEELYQLLWNGRPQSELRARPAAVLWSSSPHSSFEVNLRLERPGSNRFLR